MMTTASPRPISAEPAFRRAPIARTRAKARHLFPMWAVVVGGYLVGGRQFAYFGVSPLFIGEAYLVGQTLWNRHNWIGKFVAAVLRPELLPLAIFLHLLWGIIEVFRSLFMGFPLVDVLRTTAFNYYPLYCLIGMMIGKEITMQTYVKAWKFIIILTIIHVVLEPVLSLTDVWGLGTPMPPLATLAMISLWPHFEKWKARYVILGMTIIPIFFQGAHGHRGWMLGLIAGLVAIAIARPKHLARWLLLSSGAIIVLMIVGPLIPGPEGAGPPLDPVVQCARVLSGNFPDVAIKMVKWRGYAAEADAIRGDTGTADWRKAIWSGAIHSMKTLDVQLMGRGEGGSIGDLTPDGQDIHTPHNILIYALIYTGWVGLIIFCVLMIAMFRQAHRLVDPQLRVLTLAITLSVLEMAVSGNILEAPFGAIPFYLICGVAMGLGARKTVKRGQIAQRSYQLMGESRLLRPI